MITFSTREYNLSLLTMEWAAESQGMSVRLLTTPEMTLTITRRTRPYLAR